MAMINGEPRQRYPMPKSPRKWRHLAHRVLGQYIADHIEEEVKLGAPMRSLRLFKRPVDIPQLCF